jgi:hypothetical protein
MTERAFEKLPPEKGGYDVYKVRIPYGYTLSERILELTPSDFRYALDNIDYFIKTLEVHSFLKKGKTFEELMEQQRKEYQEKIKNLTYHVEELLEESGNYSNVIEETVNKTLKTTIHRHEEEVKFLRKVNEDYKKMNDDLKAMYNTAVENNKHTIEKVERIKDAERKRVEEDYNNVLRKLHEMRAKYETKVAGARGTIGETAFAEYIEKYTNWRDVENTSKIPQSGDLQCMINKVKTIIEVKNYTKDIPTKEVQKFMRDMDSHTETPFGIFISMNTDITGKRSTINVDWTEHGQLCILISKFQETDVEYTMKMLEQYAEVANRVYTLHHRCSEEELAMYKEKHNHIKSIITEQISDIAQLIQNIGHDRRILIDNLTKQGMMYKNTLEKIKMSACNTIDIILGARDIVEEQVIEEKKGGLDMFFKKTDVDVKPDVVVVPVVEAPVVEMPVVEKKGRKKKGG